jgi:hypothetical protein
MIMQKEVNFARHNAKRTSSCIQSTTTSVAFKVLRLLMGDEELQIFEITFA